MLFPTKQETPISNYSIYIDESGDLGFDLDKKGTKRFFIIGALICTSQTENKHLFKAVERTLKNKVFKSKKTKNKQIELKGALTEINTKKYYYKNMPKNHWSLRFSILDKKLIKKQFKGEVDKDRLYNYLARELIKSIKFGKEEVAITLYLDKLKGSKEAKVFNHYIETYLKGTLPFSSQVSCYHADSKENKGIQAIDMFLTGVYDRYNHDDLEWYKVFKEKIKYEKIYK